MQLYEFGLRANGVNVIKKNNITCSQSTASVTATQLCPCSVEQPWKRQVMKWARPLPTTTTYTKPGSWQVLVPLASHAHDPR